ncbi:MAG: hypothetical protein KC496_04730 [Anaerolineae bacterium]|nr:hypothetical protein [Anaerolineae bacterium]
MIFKQIDEIASGNKTQTRRIVKPGEYENSDLNRIYEVRTPKRRLKWYVDGNYAVVSKRGAKTVRVNGIPLRILLLSIRRERLQDITGADAQAEGVPDVQAYRQLWDSINTKKGTRWDDNPDVWVLEFDLI